MCDLQSILSLHLNHMQPTPLNIFNLLAPFSNEIANVLTIATGIKVYPHNPKGYTGLFKQYFFDILAILGIISNTIVISFKYNYNLGIIKGFLYLIFAYALPNLFMHDVLHFKLFKNNKLLIGFSIIYLLELSINTIFCRVKNNLYKEKKQDKTKIHNSDNDNANDNNKKHN